MNRRSKIQVGLVSLVVALSSAALAQNYDLSWYTIDGGGGMNSTGGSFSLSGTIGQPDASSFSTPMAGGNFTLVGGFWPVASSVCSLLGDLNHDGSVNGDDVQQFVNCLFGVAGSGCDCADFDGNGTNAGDVQLFVSALVGT